MADFIALIALFALFMLSFYYERKEKRKKKHDNWIYDCRQCLVGVAFSFRMDCQALAEDALAKYTNILQNKSYQHIPDYITYSFLSDYLEALDNLKKDYLENVTDKVKKAMRYYTFTTIPDYLIEEYSKLISDIHDAFHGFEHLMRKQIADANEQYKNMLLKGR